LKSGADNDYGLTRKSRLLESVPPGAVTVILPVVAPVGTVVLISEPETTLKVAVVPLKLTSVVPVRLGRTEFLT
jgi:hypothetical protein